MVKMNFKSGQTKIFLKYAFATLPYLGFLLFSFIMFNEVFLGMEKFIFRDLYRFAYPMGALLKDSFREGSLLWDTTINHGMPFLARLTPVIFYPSSILFLFFSPGNSIAINVIFHFLLASVSSYLVLKRFVSDARVAWLGALSFAFCGYSLSMIGSWFYLFGVALFPLGVLTLLRLNEKKNFFRAMEVALVFSLQVFSADLQTLFYQIVFIAPMICFFKKDTIAERKKYFIFLILSGLFFLGLSACQLLGTFELMLNSTRAGGISFDKSTMWSLNPLRMLEFIIPSVFGKLYPDGTYWGGAFLYKGQDNRFPWAFSVYTGMFSVLGLFFISKLNNRRVMYIVGGLLFFFFFMSFGKHTFFFKLFYDFFPGVNLFRYPEKFILFSSFFLIFLGTIGFDEFLKSSGSTEIRKPFVILVLFLITLIALLIAGLNFIDPDKISNIRRVANYFVSQTENEFIKNGSVPIPEIIIFSSVRWLQTAQMAVSKGIFINGVFLFVLLLQLAKKVNKNIKIVLLFFLVCFDLILSGESIKGSVRADWIEENIETCSYIPQGKFKWKKPFVAMYGDFPQIPMDYSGTLSRYEKIMYSNTKGLLPNTGIDQCVHHVRGYEAALLSSSDSVDELLKNNFNRWADITGVQYVIDYSNNRDIFNNAEYSLEATMLEPALKIYKNKKQLEFLHAVGKVEFINDVDRAYGRLNEEAYDYFNTAIFEGTEKSFVHENSHRASELMVYLPGKIEISLDFKKKGYLVVLESFYPGWKASIDGVDINIYKANGSFMGFKIPEGTHKLKLDFDPMIQKIANLISFLTIVIVFLILSGSFFKKARVSTGTN